MICQRCFGLCVPYYLSDHGNRISAEKCVNCGDIVDPVIMENRTHIQKTGWASIKATHPRRPVLFASLA